jgi:hypothetical protein
MDLLRFVLRVMFIYADATATALSASTCIDRVDLPIAC